MNIYELTDVEKKVMDWVSLGYNNKYISNHLHYNERTVQGIIVRIYKKMHINKNDSAMRVRATLLYNLHYRGK